MQAWSLLDFFSLIDDLDSYGSPEVWQYLNQTLFQLIDIAYALLMHPILQTAPNFGMYWV